jgi:hypothetical protein
MQRRWVMDILFIGIMIVLFIASWLFVKLVERVLEEEEYGTILLDWRHPCRGVVGVSLDSTS